MILSILAYVGLAVALAGLVSVARPITSLRIRHRSVAALVFAVGVVVTLVAITRPVTDVRVTTPVLRLDEFAPVYQFSEVHAIPVEASPERVFNAIHDVTAREIPLYRLLVWIRRGGGSGPESILNPPDDEPLLTVATRTSFVKLADDPLREFVMGGVVIAPPGIRLAIGSDPESFKALTQPGFAKVTMNFLIEPRGEHVCVLRTETRVLATDPSSRAMFTHYWRLIAPGSALIRKMWLRAIKVRAEAPARSPTPTRPSA